MSGNSERGKSVTVEDEFATPSNSDTEPSRGQINFEANFGRLSLEMLKFLCFGMGISDVGVKQDLINRLVSECKRREQSPSELLGKGKAVNVDKDT
ncbi:3947_t:CDS:1, partial [Racocetra fulgida]